MQQINCYIPIKLRITGRLDDAQLDELSETLVRALAARIAFAERSLNGGRAVRGIWIGEEPQEALDPSRDDAEANEYFVPSYDGRRPVARVPIRRRRRTVRSSPPTWTFDTIWWRFTAHRMQGRDTEALGLAEHLVDRMSFQNAVRHGVDLAIWLMDHGRWPLARRVLEKVEAGWWLRFVPETGPDVPSGAGAMVFSSSGGPRSLIDRAKTEGRAQRTDQAFLLFAMAFRLLQMQLLQSTERRTSEMDRLEGLGAAAGVLPQLGFHSSYASLHEIYGMMREIVGFYPQLEREALISGDRDLANRFLNLGFALRLELEESTFGFGTAELRRGEPEAVAAARRVIHETYRAITMETTRTETSRGPGLILHGALGQEETVYPLPGLELPQERFPPAMSPVEELVEVMTDQEEFITRLYRHPEIVAEFGRHPPNMNNLQDRLRVWQTMHRVFQREDIGFGSLHRLMNLMEQYLGLFTRHTEYDVRDFGVSYLTSDFPQDLVGRAARDCGVYALSVAYEVYQTARNARPRLPVEFRLYVMPEHIALVIFDLAQDTHYVVNNNHIDGPFRGDVGESLTRLVVARLYAEARGLRFGVSPVVSVELGSTSLGEREFRRVAWQRFRLGVGGWRLRPEPGSAQTEAARVNEAYRRYYEAIELFNTHAGQLSTGLDALVREISTRPPAAQRRLLAEHLPGMMNQGVALARIMTAYTPRHAIQWTRSGRDRNAQSHLGYYYIPTGTTTSHPLARLGKALLYYERLGRTLEDEQRGFNQWLHTVPAFREDLDRYDQQNRPPHF